MSEDFLEILRSERRDLLERLRKTKFSTLREGFSQSQLVPYASYSPWLDDKEFKSYYDRVSKHTLVDQYRCYELYSTIKQLVHVPGEVVEVGVWRGGTAALLALASEEKRIVVFDTFSGVVKADSTVDTIYRGGEHADTAVQIVVDLFENLGVVAKINQGVFPDETLGGLPAVIRFAHIDVDTYASAKESFLAIWPRVSVGGAVIFDDYGFFGCEGVVQAVNEIKEDFKNLFVLYNLNGHAVLLKVK